MARAKLFLKRTAGNLTHTEQSEIAIDILRIAGIRGEIKKGTHGKPYTDDCTLRFNISHTCGAVAVAVGDCEIGVDIQCIKPISDRLMRRYLGQDIPSDPKERIRLWTEYESYGKWLSCGIPITLPDLPHRFFHTEFNNTIVTVCTDCDCDGIDILYID